MALIPFQIEFRLNPHGFESGNIEVRPDDGQPMQIVSKDQALEDPSYGRDSSLMAQVKLEIWKNKETLVPAGVPDWDAIKAHVEAATFVREG